jgi:hypothetical protein
VLHPVKQRRSSRQRSGSCAFAVRQRACALQTAAVGLLCIRSEATRLRLTDLYHSCDLQSRVYCKAVPEMKCETRNSPRTGKHFNSLTAPINGDMTLEPLTSALTAHARSHRDSPVQGRHCTAGGTIPTERPPVSVKLMPTFVARGVWRGQSNGSPRPLITVF